MKLTKIASLILAIALVFSLGITAFAEELGSITINGASNTNTYEIYKLLDLESYNVTDGKYAYKVNPVWDDFFETAEAKGYFTVDTQGYATWTNEKDDDDTVAAFAKLALAYAKEKGIDPVKSTKNIDEFTLTGTTLKFSDLELGYYLIDSTMGALCGLTTTNPDAYINAKNAAPTIEKQVKEDSTDQWMERNTADIGQDVEFRITINVHEGAENYILHDTLSAGLTFKEVTLIEHVIPGTGSHPTEPSKYTVVTTPVCEINEGNPCSFEIQFSQAFCDSLATNDKVIIYYTATLNEGAVVGTDPNTNNAILEYGEDHTTSEKATETRTYAFDLVKTDSQNKLIDGAEFLIYDVETEGTPIPVVKIGEKTYRRAKSGESGVPIAVEDGKVRVIGFDNGTYYLEETTTPEGYNQLAARHKFIISDDNLDAIVTDGIVSTGSGVHVVNKSGTMLPETGGIGTTLFYVVGGILVAGSLVFLVTKKRMGNR